MHENHKMPLTTQDALLQFGGRFKNNMEMFLGNFPRSSRVTVTTPLTDLSEYLRHLLKSTNMRCLTPEKALSGQCGFMAANMYARSIFGEDALANLSIEKPFNKPDAPVAGHIRIRAKSQGMALSLGDKINMTQKGTQNKVVAAA